MSRPPVFRCLAVAALCLLGCVAAATAAKSQPGAVIVTPRQKQKVNSNEELIGRVLERGVPIVLVRADQPDSQWWVQGVAEATTKGHFKADIRFGNENTVDGTPFRIVVLMAQSVEDAEKYAPGDALQELPDAPRSLETAVVYERKREPPQLVQAISSPRPKSTVNRYQQVAGRVTLGTHPVIVVRSAEPNSFWWVQSPVAIDDEGNFHSMARFGGEHTKDGSGFRVLALLFKRHDHAERFKPGMALKELPSTVERSIEVQLFRGGVSTNENSSSSPDKPSATSGS